MSDSNPVSNAIKNAAQILKSSFGSGAELSQENEFRYIDEASLIDMYKTEIEKNKTSDLLSSVQSSISGMRSGYMPTQLLVQATDTLSILTSITSEDTSSDISDRESFENTFMRMLGMPMSDEISNEVGTINIVTPDGNIEQWSYEDVEKYILDIRQLPKSERTIEISNKIYQINQQIEPTTVDEIDLDKQYFGNQDVSDIIPPKITNLEDEIFKYCYLLLPPVQDHRISKCINETNKIVPTKFSNQQGWNINGKELHSSLLESIIRIRLDRLSGTTAFSEVEIDELQDSEVLPDDYGLLEALCILRISSAIKALGIVIGTKIDDLISIYEETGLVPDGNEDLPDSLGTNPTKDEQGEIVEEEFNLFQKQKIIEDSFMSLFNDNSKALDLQIETQRKTSIIDSHLMSPIFGIIDLPRKRISSEIIKKEESSKGTSNGPGDKTRKEISSILGVYSGVGSIDILIFTLALFTINENYLVSLLNNIEYEKLKTEFTGIGSTIPAQKLPTSVAINELTKYIISGYKLFESSVQNGAAQNIQSASDEQTADNDDDFEDE